MRQITRKANAQHQIIQVQRREQANGISQSRKNQSESVVRQRIFESRSVAELFFLLNDTNWNKFDDKFFLVNRKWFDRWKDFICYDYIVKQLVALGRPISDLPANFLLSSNPNPGEISNLQLVQELRDSQQKNKVPSLAYCNRKLKKSINVDGGDIIYLSEPIWALLHSIYGGEEISRYAVQKNASSVLIRSPELPQVQVTLVIQAESIRGARTLILPRKCQIKLLKEIIHESNTWLRQSVPIECVRLWHLIRDARDSDFTAQYNEQLKLGELPSLLKFPGYSLEHPDMETAYVEECYLGGRTIFVEVKRPQRGQWVFDFDLNDDSFFERKIKAEGQNRALVRREHQIYDTPQQEGYFGTWYKFRNFTTSEYSNLRPSISASEKSQIKSQTQGLRPQENEVDNQD